MNLFANRLGDQRGIALVATLLILLGFTALASMAALTAMTEKSATLHHRVANRSLFAADAGTEAAKQLMTDWAQTKMDSLNTVWGGNGTIIPDPATFFPAEGLVMQFAGPPAFETVTTLAFEDTSLNQQSQSYDFLFSTVSSGTYAAGERGVVSEGRLRVSATRGSFADYLLFTDTHLMPGDSPIWFHTSGYFDGRVHTNGTMRFAYFPTFEDHATQVDDKAYFYNNGSSVYLDDDHNSNKDVPNFYGGFDRDVPVIDLPDNSFSQERAALGGNPANTSALANSEVRDLLGLTPGTTAPPNGVYVPNGGGYVTGGIFVQGDALRLALSVGTGDKQVISIKDENNATSVIEIDYAANTTKVTPPSGTPTTYTGVPNGAVYTKGEVVDLRGPDRSGSTVVPAIAPQSQLLIAAMGDVNITRDLSAKNFDAAGNVMGIFTSGGDVRITEDAPDELHVDSFVMASDDGKVFTVDNYNSGDYRGQVHLRGGMITNYYGAFGTFGGDMTGYGRDFRYDSRGLVPPYFPLTQRFVTDRPVPQVLAWREAAE